LKQIVVNPPKLSEISSSALRFLDNIQFSTLRDNVKRRNKKNPIAINTKQIDRRLVLRKYPNKRNRRILQSKFQVYNMYRDYKASEILDFFNPKRKSYWKKGVNRTKTLDIPIDIKNFSFIDYPDNTLSLFYELAEYEPYVQEAKADFIDTHVVDIARERP